MQPASPRSSSRRTPLAAVPSLSFPASPVSTPSTQTSTPRAPSPELDAYLDKVQECLDLIGRHMDFPNMKRNESRVVAAKRVVELRPHTLPTCDIQGTLVVIEKVVELQHLDLARETMQAYFTVYPKYCPSLEKKLIWIMTLMSKVNCEYALEIYENIQEQMTFTVGFHVAICCCHQINSPDTAVAALRRIMRLTERPNPRDSFKVLDILCKTHRYQEVFQVYDSLLAASNQHIASDDLWVVSIVLKACREGHNVDYALRMMKLLIQSRAPITAGVRTLLHKLLAFAQKEFTGGEAWKLEEFRRLFRAIKDQ